MRRVELLWQRGIAGRSAAGRAFITKRIYWQKFQGPNPRNVPSLFSWNHLGRQFLMNSPGTRVSRGQRRRGTLFSSRLRQRRNSCRGPGGAVKHTNRASKSSPPSQWWPSPVSPSRGGAAQAKYSVLWRYAARRKLSEPPTRRQAPRDNVQDQHCQVHEPQGVPPLEFAPAMAAPRRADASQTSTIRRRHAAAPRRQAHSASAADTVLLGVDCRARGGREAAPTEAD